MLSYLLVLKLYIKKIIKIQKKKIIKKYKKKQKTKNLQKNIEQQKLRLIFNFILLYNYLNYSIVILK